MEIPRAMLQEALDFFEGYFNLTFKIREVPTETGELGRGVFRGRLVRIMEFDPSNPGESDVLLLQIFEEKHMEQLHQAWASYLCVNYQQEENKDEDGSTKTD